jgi:hypothetical protein
VHGLEALVHETAPDETSELPCDGRLIGRGHGQVRIVPVAEDTQALELFALDVDELGGVLATAPPLLDGIHGPAHVHARRVEAELHVHLVLDGQSVAVPPWHVG